MCHLLVLSIPWDQQTRSCSILLDCRLPCLIDDLMRGITTGFPIMDWGCPSRLLTKRARCTNAQRRAPNSFFLFRFPNWRKSQGSFVASPGGTTHQIFYRPHFSDRKEETSAGNRRWTSEKAISGRSHTSKGAERPLRSPKGTDEATKWGESHKEQQWSRQADTDKQTDEPVDVTWCCSPKATSSWAPHQQFRVTEDNIGWKLLVVGSRLAGCTHSLILISSCTDRPHGKWGSLCMPLSVASGKHGRKDAANFIDNGMDMISVDHKVIHQQITMRTTVTPTPTTTHNVAQ